MKKTTITTLLFLASLATFAQDSTKAHKDTLYALVLTKQDIVALFSIIKAMDEKPSIVNSTIQYLESKLQMLPPPKETKNK